MSKKNKKRAQAKKKRKQTLLPPQDAAQAEAPMLDAPKLEALVAELPEVTSPAPISEPPPSLCPEKRASERASLSVELHMSSDSHIFTGLSGDISEGGVFVQTYRELADGSAVDMEFWLPGSNEALHLSGIVRWHRDGSPDAPPGVGIAFDELSNDERDRIHRFCSIRPPLYYDVG
jgi:uncharacterized protein (TIGR02266 family)